MGRRAGFRAGGAPDAARPATAGTAGSGQGELRRGRCPVLGLLSQGAFAVAVIWPFAAANGAGSAIELRGRGVQVYACEGSAGSFAWRFKGPDATLADAAGNVAGRHFAGPSWQAKDGSEVVGEVVGSSASPDADAIPWLVLRAKARSGTGLFSSVAFIVRSNTSGGLAPAAGCDQGHVGAEARVPYTATYVLFPGG